MAEKKATNSTRYFWQVIKTKDEVSMAQTLLTLRNNDKESSVADELDRMPSDPGCNQRADASHANDNDNEVRQVLYY